MPPKVRSTSSPPLRFCGLGFLFAPFQRKRAAADTTNEAGSSTEQDAGNTTSRGSNAVAPPSDTAKSKRAPPKKSSKKDLGSPEDVEPENSPAPKKARSARSQSSVTGAKPETDVPDNASTARSTKSSTTKKKAGKASLDVEDKGESSEGLDPKSYTPQRVKDLFSKYADEDNTELIATEGMVKLCEDARIPIDGCRPLLISWLLDAKSMGQFTLEEWERGLTALRIDTLQKLALAVGDLEGVLFRGASLDSAGKKKAVAPYSNNTFREYAANNSAAFSKFYSFCFSLAKPESQRNIDMDTTLALWSVVLAPKYSVAEELCQFVKEKGTYKGANKDLWSMTLEFCKSYDPATQKAGEDGESEAWPTMLDEFMAWKKERSSA